MKNILEVKEMMENEDSFNINKLINANNIHFNHNDSDNLHNLSMLGWIQKNYKLSTETYKIDKNSIESLEKDLDTFNLKKYKIKQASHILYIFKNDDFIIRVKKYKDENKAYVYLSSKDLKTIEIISKIINNHENELLDSEVEISSYYISMSGRLEQHNKSKTIESFNLNKLYYPYLDIEELFKQFIMSEDNILVLTGLPGTGKTALTDSYMEFFLKSEFVKKFFNKNGPVNFPVAYIKNETILSTDEFWMELQYYNYNLIILDDLDYSLLPRTQEISTQEDINKNKFISNLLSYTDGIFDENSKTKFIITTNKEVKEIDSAILRKGRTFDILQLRSLTSSEALDVWVSEGLEEKKFNEIFKNDNILPCDLGSEISKIKASMKYHSKINPYVKEDGISLYSSSKKQKRIGFKN